MAPCASDVWSAKPCDTRGSSSFSKMSPSASATNVGRATSTHPFSAVSRKLVVAQCRRNERLKSPWIAMRRLEHEPAARRVVVKPEHLVVELVDGRSRSVPLPWYPQLLHATAVERQNV